MIRELSTIKTYAESEPMEMALFVGCFYHCIAISGLRKSHRVSLVANGCEIVDASVKSLQARLLMLGRIRKAKANGMRVIFTGLDAKNLRDLRLRVHGLPAGEYVVLTNFDGME